MSRKNRWIQAAAPKKGALHRQLGYPPNETLPKGLVSEISKANIGTHVRGYTVTPLLKHRSQFAVNVRKFRK